MKFFTVAINVTVSTILQVTSVQYQFNLRLIVLYIIIAS